tara:strand:+ start:1118 stop:2023 length:906 start_codon:yes stop_codon:yes gene_type:complete
MGQLLSLGGRAKAQDTVQVDTQNDSSIVRDMTALKQTHAQKTKEMEERNAALQNMINTLKDQNKAALQQTKYKGKAEKCEGKLKTTQEMLDKQTEAVRMLKNAVPTNNRLQKFLKSEHTVHDRIVSLMQAIPIPVSVSPRSTVVPLLDFTVWTMYIYKVRMRGPVVLEFRMVYSAPEPNGMRQRTVVYKLQVEFSGELKRIGSQPPNTVILKSSVEGSMKEDVKILSRDDLRFGGLFDVGRWGVRMHPSSIPGQAPPDNMVVRWINPFKKWRQLRMEVVVKGIGHADGFLFRNGYQKRTKV